MIRARYLVCIFAIAAISAPAIGPNRPLDCDRQMRKTLEALQAWRRLHNGQYPGRLVDLQDSGLMPHDGAICPDLLREINGADTPHGLLTSSQESGDPAGMYEYELSSAVDQSKGDRFFLPNSAPSYTRQDQKVVLLRRPFFEQVPILRCGRHGAGASASSGKETEAWRNATATGTIYWSDLYWEQVWLKDVPLCARDANVLFGLEGPPFAIDRAPTLESALDLRKWNCAFGDCAWWWCFPMFDQSTNRQAAANLRPLFLGQHARQTNLSGTQWWLNGLVQLQGKINKKEWRYSAPQELEFVWEKTALPVGRSFREASWIQGTVWPARKGDIAGWLVWHFNDETSEKVPLIYGETTGRFWGGKQQIEREKGFPEPVWTHHETAAEVGVERWLRLYRQSWTNPHPDKAVTTLDFISNRDCQAAPFLIAINVSN